MAQGQLVRIPQGQIIGGVCTGLARYFNMDVTLVRIIVAAGRSPRRPFHRAMADRT